MATDGKSVFLSSRRALIPAAALFLVSECMLEEGYPRGRIRGLLRADIQ